MAKLLQASALEDNVITPGAKHLLIVLKQCAEFQLKAGKAPTSITEL